MLIKLAKNLSLVLLGLQLATFPLPALSQNCSKQIEERNKANSEVKKIESKIRSSNNSIKRLNKKKTKDSSSLTELKEDLKKIENSILECSKTKCKKAKRLEAKKRLLSFKIKKLETKISRATGSLSELQNALQESNKSLEVAKEKLAAAKSALEACKVKPTVTPTPTSTGDVEISKFTFDNLDVGAKFGIYSSFQFTGSGGILSALTGKVEPFHYLQGGSSSSSDQGSALQIVDQQFLNQDNKFVGIWPGNVLAKFKVPEGICLSKVTIKYKDFGGEVNLYIGETLYKRQDFSSLNNINADRYTIKVASEVETYQDAGSVEISSNCLTQFGVGGQELFIDEIVVLGYKVS